QLSNTVANKLEKDVAIGYPHCFKIMSEASQLFLLCPARLFLIYGIISFLNLHCSRPALKYVNSFDNVPSQRSENEQEADFFLQIDSEDSLYYFMPGERDLSFQLNGADVNVTKERWRRSSNNPPQPIDCVLSSWSSWSTCEPCQKKRYRFAHVEQPSQFGGDQCDYTDKETEDCVTSTPCRNTVRCEGFVCGTGRCINRRLLCNGDDDCGDQSDERNCKKIYRRCNQPVEQYWGIQMLASGLNIFTNHLEGLVLDHRYYGGACSPQNIGGTSFRKPFNVQSYLAVTKGKFGFTSTEYESYSSFEENVSKAKSKQESFSIGFKIPTLFHFGYSQDDMRYQKFIERTKHFASMSRKFIHAHSELQVAEYRLKNQNLMLHYEFFQRVRQLPLEYNYGEYRELFRDYGTHYITEATLGGTYEYTLIVNGEELQKAGI
ncbi:hypothetical protein JD844_017911, partial [Phrynosoma platyrhinos]